MKTFLITALVTALVAGCVERETWSCVIDGDVMYSMSSKGQLGGAQKGCTCDEIRQFELKVFGEVDEEALKRDFGCKMR